MNARPAVYFHPGAASKVPPNCAREACSMRCRSGRLRIGTFGNTDPACGGTRILKQDKHFDDVGIVLVQPVAAGEADVDGAALDVASPLLRPDQAAFHFVVVDSGKFAARRRRDAPAGIAEHFNRGLVEADLGGAEIQELAHSAQFCRCEVMVFYFQLLRGEGKINNQTQVLQAFERTKE